MPKRDQLREEAITQLDEIWLYGAETWSIEQANAYDDKLHQMFLHLVQHPQLGKLAENRKDGVRYVIEGHHVIVYEPHGDDIIVMAVFSQRQQWFSFIQDL